MSDAVRGEILVSGDAERVLEVVADFESYPEWQEEIKEAEVLETDPEGRGTRARFVVDAGVLKATVVLAYSYTDGAMRWVLVEGDQVKRNDGAYTMTDRGDGTTLVTYELVIEPAVPLPGFLKRRAAQRIIDRALLAMKQRVEGTGR